MKQSKTEQELRNEIVRLKHDRNHMLMFFQVATDNMGFDPSCQPGKLDAMCVAEALRGMRAEITKARKNRTIFEGKHMTLRRYSDDSDRLWLESETGEGMEVQTKWFDGWLRKMFAENF